MEKILVVIKYDGKELESIEVNNIRMEDIEAIQKRPIKDWFEPIAGRLTWHGLEKEIRQFAIASSAELCYEFIGPEESKVLFETYLGKKADGLPPEEVVLRHIKEAKRFENKGNGKKAFYQYLEAAKFGNIVDAQRKVAEGYYAHFQGKENFIDISKEEAGKLAVDYFKMAAKQNDLESQWQLYYFYSKGEIVLQNWESALIWLGMACKQGDGKALYEYGRCWEYGRGVKQSYTKAFACYQKASEKNEPYAQLRLGRCYEIGCGIEVDLKAAVSCYQKASANGVRSANDYLKQCMEKAKF